MVVRRLGPMALVVLLITLSLSGCGQPPQGQGSGVSNRPSGTPSAIVTSGPSATAPTQGAPSPTAEARGTVAPSPTATPVAATQTPRPTTTPTAPSAPAPTATAAGFTVAPVLAKALRDYSRPLMGHGVTNTLGMAVEPAHETKLALQAFGPFSAPGICHSRDSLMLWREDTGQIYFLLVENQGLHWDACPDFWQVFDDTWRPGGDNNEDITAPEGKVVPRAGFGKVWREEFYDKPGYSIGFPSAVERYATATVQRLEHGTAFYFGDNGTIYVLFDDFRYLTRGGESVGKVWLKVE